MKDFLVAHYTCGRNDTEFWKYIDSGATMTPFVENMRGLCTHRVPNTSMFPKQEGSAGWPLWSFVLAGTGQLTDDVARREIEFNKTDVVSTTSYLHHITQFEQMAKDLPDNTKYIKG